MYRVDMNMNHIALFQDEINCVKIAAFEYKVQKCQQPINLEDNDNACSSNIGKKVECYSSSDDNNKLTMHAHECSPTAPSIEKEPWSTYVVCNHAQSDCAEGSMRL